jgi:hypothetical protein
MKQIQALSPHHELNFGGIAPWPVPGALSLRDIQADPAARCCRECGRNLLLLLLESHAWVSHRNEHVSFRDDRTVVRRVTVEFHVPDEAPVFLGDDGQAYRLVPLSVVRRKTLVNFRLRDDGGRSVVMPSLRQNQAITESVLLACADATLARAGGARGGAQGEGTRAGVAGHPEIARFVHQVVSGDQQALSAAYASLDDGTAAPVILRLARQRMFRTILDRLADNFLLWVMIPAGAPRRRVLVFCSDEPLHLRYRKPGLRGNTYELGPPLGPWRPVVWRSALGFTPTRIRFQVPAAENAASFHFEIDAPKGVQVTEASLLAGRPSGANPAFDHVRGGFPTVGLHVIEVPNGSLSRAQIGFQVVTRGWLTTSTLSAWAVFGLLLAFALHIPFLRRNTELPALILVTLVGGVAALLAQSDAKGLAAHLLKWTRSLATLAAALPLIATTYLAFDAGRPDRLVPALWAVAGAGGGIALILTTVCLLARWRQRKNVESPWEQYHKRTDMPRQPADFAEATREYGYDQPAMRVDSPEGWHTEFIGDQQGEDQLIEALTRQYLANRSAPHHVGSLLGPPGGRRPDLEPADA